MKPTIKIEVSRKGMGDEPMRQALSLIFSQFRWLVPTRFSESEENYQAIGDDPISDCMSLFRGERVRLVVKGKGGELNFLARDKTEEDSIGKLSYYASSSSAFQKKSSERIESELLELARVLHSPHAAAFDDDVETARAYYWDGDSLEFRGSDHELGLLTPKWREIFGPRISGAMIDGLRALEGTQTRNFGDGFWLLRTYENPEDGLTEVGRAKEEEIIDVLGRRFFYDFETETKAYYRRNSTDSLW